MTRGSQGAVQGKSTSSEQATFTSCVAGARLQAARGRELREQARKEGVAGRREGGAGRPQALPQLRSRSWSSRDIAEDCRSGALAPAFVPAITRDFPGRRSRGDPRGRRKRRCASPAPAAATRRAPAPPPSSAPPPGPAPPPLARHFPGAPSPRCWC